MGEQEGDGTRSRLRQVQEPSFSSSCLPKVVDYASTRPDLVATIVEGPLNWPFMDRLLVWLAPIFREDVERFHAGTGPAMSEQFQEQQIAAIDRVLRPHLEARLRAPSAQSSSVEDELKRLRTENERLRAEEMRARIRISNKGAVSVYGLGRYPVTLYQDQWRRLLDLEDDLRQFIRENATQLRTKPR